MGARPTPRSGLLLLVLLTAPLFFLGLGAWGFIEPTESRYAEIPREMLARRDYLTPTLNGVLYFEKPPLLYWLVAGSYRVLGIHEAAARLVPALCALLGVLVAWRLGSRMFGARAGLLGAVITASNLLYAITARALMIDMLFTTALLCALALWWRGHTDRGARAWLCDALAWVALGLAVLAKGPVALVLAGGTTGLYALCCGRLSSLWRRSALLTAPLLFAVAAPWFVRMSAEHPSFDHFFWYEQHVGRFVGEDDGGYHREPFYFFFLYLPLLFLPWSALVPGAILACRGRLLPAVTPRRRAAVFLLGGAAVTTLFFSISSGKLLPYVLPVMPLLALPLGAWLDELLDAERTAPRDARSAGRPTTQSGTARDATTAAASLAMVRRGAHGLAVVLGAAGIGALILGPDMLRDLADRGPGLAVLVGVALLAFATAVYLAARRGRLGALLVTLPCGLTALFVILVFVVAPLAPNVTLGPLIAAVRPGLDAGAELVSYKGYLPGACWSADRRIVINGGAGELSFGRDQLSPDERARWFPEGLDALAAQLDRSLPTYCIVRSHENAAELIGQLGPQVQEIAWNRKRAVIGNAAAAALTPPVGRVGSPGDEPARGGR